MAANKEDIQRWFQEGIKKGATHMLVVCDTFDWEDYPSYVMLNEKVREKAKQYENQEDGVMKLMEVYNLNENMEDQLNKQRCFNYGD